MRARASLGIETPVLTTGICSSSDVIAEVGDDALGWNFVGVQTQEDTPGLAILQEIMAPVLGVEPAEVDSTALGLGGLGVLMTMSMAEYSNRLAADGGEMTGQGCTTSSAPRRTSACGREAPTRLRVVATLSGDLRVHLPVRGVHRVGRGPDDPRPRGRLVARLPAVTPCPPPPRLPSSMTDYIFYLLLGSAARRDHRGVRLGLVITYQGSGVVELRVRRDGHLVGLRVRRPARGRLPLPDPGAPGPLPLR